MQKTDSLDVSAAGPDTGAEGDNPTPSPAAGASRGVLQGQESGETLGSPFIDNPKMSARDVNVFYEDKQAIADVSLDIGHNEILAMIGPSGCGKSTFLRSLNRMNDIIPTCRVQGRITLDGEDIYEDDQDTVMLRARVGMVFQKPTPFPKSIYENVAYGPRIHGLARGRAELDEIVERSLRRASTSNNPTKQYSDTTSQRHAQCHGPHYSVGGSVGFIAHRQNQKQSP